MLLNNLEFHLMNNPLRRYVQKNIEVGRLKRISSLKTNKKILEIGCGCGYGTFLIQENFKPEHITATDLDIRMVNIARQKNLENVVYQVADASKLPFKDNSFDSVIEFAIIHHIPNWQKSFEEVYRVLKPDGELVLEDLSIETFSTPLGKMLKKILDHPYEDMYTSEEFVNGLKLAGFKDVKIKHYSTLRMFPYFVVSARK